MSIVEGARSRVRSFFEMPEPREPDPYIDIVEEKPEGDEWTNWVELGTRTWERTIERGVDGSRRVVRVEFHKHRNRRTGEVVHVYQFHKVRWVGEDNNPGYVNTDMPGDVWYYLMEEREIDIS